MFNLKFLGLFIGHKIFGKTLPTNKSLPVTKFALPYKNHINFSVYLLFFLENFHFIILDIISESYYF